MKNNEIWGKAEVSTRNCYNAIVGNGDSIDGTFQATVDCRVGKKMFDGDNNKLNDKRVASRGVLFASCKKCADFDNEWD
jgi:hypothetical protein|tara:strand:+ start:2137 stop:2373 length:237 start_codon:yes stop_codon:yes gene_type:complete